MRILITFDGSKIGESAAAVVSEWALGSKAELMLLMVLHPGQATDRPRAEMAKYLSLVGSKYFPNASTNVIIEFDEDVAGTIVRMADKRKADVVAMATHGRTGLGHAILGSVAEAVVRHAKVPVMLVGPRLRERQHAD